MASSLQPVDRIEIMVLVDNFTDMLLSRSTEEVIRPAVGFNGPLLAEHGLSFLVNTSTREKSHTFLLDTGLSETTLVHNAALLQTDLSAIEEIVISHGHFDHTGALIAILRMMMTRIPIHLHPEAFVSRRIRQPDGSYGALPGLQKDSITHAGGILNLSTSPSLIYNRSALLSGEIERDTPFETGSPLLEMKKGDHFIHDTFPDDQSVIFHLKGKGLVILSGCAHAGIINSVRHARQITGIDTIHAVIGGFHLSGAPDDVVDRTVAAMQECDPHMIVPLHCSGMNAIFRFLEAMPGQVVINTVGTRYRFVGC